MVRTGVLGTKSSRPGIFELGEGLAPLVIAVSALDALAFAEAVSHPGNTGYTVSFTGVLGTSASQPGSVELSLGLAVSGLAVSISESLNLVETASYPRVPVSASDALTLSETASSGRRINLTVAEALTFVEADPWTGPHYEFAAGRLNLIELVTGHLTTVHLQVSEGILFVENAGQRWALSVSEALALVESTKNPTKAADMLTLIESVLVAKAQSLSEVISWAETAGVVGSFGRTSADVIALIESASYFVTNPSIECTYSPFIGASNGDYTPPSATPPVLGTGVLTLTYPYVSPTTTLVLRNPNTGNNDKLTYNRLNQQTRGGSLVVFADPQWPKFKTRSFQIDAIPDASAPLLLQFLQDSLGLEIGLLDWEGRQWRGIIVNPEAVITQLGACNYSVSLDFEGELA